MMIDVCVIGNDFSAYTAVYELSKRGYNVLHHAPFEHYFVEQFKPTQKLTVCDVDRYFLGTHLTIEPFLKELNIFPTLEERPPYKEILSDGRVLQRNMDKKSFKIYLYRHFAKEHLALDKWFKAIENMYQSFQAFRNDQGGELEKKSPMIFEKIKNLTLKEWLDSYFESSALKESINVFYTHEGESLETIMTRDFLLTWFYLFEEDAKPLKLSYKNFVKTIKKQSKDAIFINSPIDSIKFKRNHYEITFKNKDTYQVKFVLGNEAKKETKAYAYRWIDLDIEPKYFDTHFKERVVFKETPLFKHLSIDPLHLLDPDKKGYLRIEAISESSPELLINFVSRYYKDFENVVRSFTERPPQHLNKKDYYDLFIELESLESMEDLFEKPKWIPVSLNDAFKPLIPLEIHKGLFYTHLLDQALKEEKNPSKTSIIRSLLDPFVHKFEPTNETDFNLQIGLREFYFSPVENGIVYQLKPSENTIHLKEESYLQWLDSKTMLNDAILNEEGKHLGLLDGLLKNHEVFKMPFGFMVTLVLVLLSLIPFIVPSIPNWLMPVSYLIMAAVIFGLTKKVSGLSLLFFLLSSIFLIDSSLLNYYAYFWIVSGAVLLVSQGIKKRVIYALDKDPIRNELSDYYFKQYMHFYTTILSGLFIGLGFIALFNHVILVIGFLVTGLILMSGFMFLYPLPYKMEKGDMHDSH